MSKTITDMTTALVVLALNISKKRRDMFDPKKAPANATKFSVVSDEARHVVDLTTLDREELNTLFRTMVKTVEDKKSGSFIYISRTEDTIMSRAVNNIEARIFNADYFYDIYKNQRGLFIQRYLDTLKDQGHDVDYVCIDDDGDYSVIDPLRFIQVKRGEMTNGFNMSHFQKVDDHFSKAATHPEAKAA